MSYCTIQDILKDIDQTQLIYLLNDENRTAGEIDLEDADDVCVIRANEIIADADEEINGYLRRRYELPFTSTPTIIKRLSKEISIRNIKRRRHRDDLSESEETAYRSVIRTLENIQKSVIDIGAEETDPVEGEFVVNKTEDDRVFPKSVLDMF